MDRQSERVAEFTRRRNNRNKLYRLIAVMGLLVVAFTAFMLIRPAITMEGQAKILNCQYIVHQHDDSCYKENADGEKELVCGKADYVIHEHEESCYDSSGKLICPLNAVSPEEAELHTHTEDCYDESGDLTCDKLEVLAHTHEDECFETADSTQAASEEFTLTAKTDSGITVTVTGPADALPYPADEITVTVEEITDEESEDIRDKALKEDNLKAAENYLFDVCLWHDGEEIEPTSELTLSFSGLPLENGNKTVVYHIDKEKKDAVNMDAVTDDKDNVVLDTDHFSTYSVSLLAASGNNSVTVYQVNNYNRTDGSAKTILVYGGSVGSKLAASGMSFAYWDAIVVEQNENGELYVAQYVTDSNSKKEYKADTAAGFVLLINDVKTSVNVSVGDIVTVNFNYNTANGYNSTGHGTVTFSASSAPKNIKDNSSQLHIVDAASTRDFIELNLYDYGSGSTGKNINDKFNADKKMPGFQQSGGTSNIASLDDFKSTGYMNFGDIITSDLADGKLVTLSSLNPQGINVVQDSANSPISRFSTVMQGTLADGYPALADGTSLGYLFGSESYSKKMNSQSIDGLFQYDENTGAYSFNSRTNFAQYNQNNDTFTLYEEIFTPNFIMYPFGNFMPFNDIVHDSKQVSQINEDYFEELRLQANYLYQQGNGDQYAQLAKVLGQFMEYAKQDNWVDDWTAERVLEHYFYWGSELPEPEDNDNNYKQISLDRLYSLDYDVASDFYFGMEMKMNFMQPKGGLTGNNGQQPMVFYFTGDDDVWVYIDNKLFLDLSGIHRHVGGEIDFVNGVVNYYSLDTKTGDVSTTPYKTVKFSELVDSSLLNEQGTFKDYSSHSFNFYYMERGSGSSVCRLNFNFPLLKKNSISVTKKVTADSDISKLGNPDFKFQVLEENGNDLFIGAGTQYEIYNANNNELIGTGTTDTNGVFTLKADQTAVFTGINENSGRYFVRELFDKGFEEQYGTVTVNGSSVTKNNDIEVGSSTFTGFDSSTQDVSNGSTIFEFNNNITTNKLGKLQISKTLTPYQSGSTDDVFNMNVTLDGNNLPEGTPYTVTRTTGEGTVTTEAKTVGTAGIISLKAGETAEISNIIAGTVFTVQETEASAKGYTVTYSGDGVTTDGNSATGKVKPTGDGDTAVKVTVTNVEGGASVQIPVSKTVKDAKANGEHSYSFTLEQVTDETGKTSVDGGTTQNLTIEFDNEEENYPTGNGSFNLVYLEKNLPDKLPATFYYRITEDEGVDSSIVYDKTAYVAEVEVNKGEDGKLTASIKGLYKEGALFKLEDSIPFTNTQLYSLTVKKTIDNGGSSEVGIDKNEEFTFKITLKDKNGNSLAGEYEYEARFNGGNDTAKLVFKDGEATVELKHNEYVEIRNLPAGTKWQVTEEAASGYIANYSTNGENFNASNNTGENTISGSDDTVIFKNTVASYALPETGGIGTLPFTIAGIILIFGAGAILYRTRLRRRED